MRITPDHLNVVNVVNRFLDILSLTLSSRVDFGVSLSSNKVIFNFERPTVGRILGHQKMNGKFQQNIVPRFSHRYILKLYERLCQIMVRKTGSTGCRGSVYVTSQPSAAIPVNRLSSFVKGRSDGFGVITMTMMLLLMMERFQYLSYQDDGGRGVFDWRFFYKRLPLLPEQQANLPEPFQNPVMNGGLFAISRKFFWELGGYDLGIKIWGGEQYQLSFKIWQCGGQLLDAPCSRVGHIFRHPLGRPPSKTGDINVNYKRVMSVWMDEYAEAVYRRKPNIREVDAGDITKELKIRARLQCKPFKWFLENVAPDLTKYYPAVEPSDFANGQIRSMADKKLCIDKGGNEHEEVILYFCHPVAGETQRFNLCWQNTIRSDDDQWCLEARTSHGTAPFMGHCPLPGRNINTMTWKYDVKSKQLMNMGQSWCLEADTNARKVKLVKCDTDNVSQMWDYEHIH
ncbi:unnamed protein product, partial [Meganyctiphanes norvegica]